MADYIIRTLNDTEAEVDEFCNHCVNVFSVRENPVPKGLFLDHWFHDPDRTVEGVQVAVAPTDSTDAGKIISTVRVFHRTLQLGPFGSLPAGAIGEVSTNTAHTKRGLASKLLRNAEAHMKKHGLKIGILHTGAAAPVYEKLGWKTIPMPMIAISCDNLMALQKQSSIKSNFDLRDIIASHDLSLIQRLHAQFAPLGSFQRSEAYWKSWVLEDRQDDRYKIAKRIVRAQLEDRNVVGYIIMSIRSDIDKAESGTEVVSIVRDVFIGVLSDDETKLHALDANTFSTVSALLARSALEELLPSNPSSKLRIELPQSLLPDSDPSLPSESWLRSTNRTELQDIGWMWRVVEPVMLSCGDESILIKDEDDLANFLKKPRTDHWDKNRVLYGFLHTDDF
ncbi:acyl-CoA N-acyltransferase [Phlyctochytrium arcticum]|nr:acyl-CoA N-acyltransferase [Phlyctochytrium arcticum]